LNQAYASDVTISLVIVHDTALNHFDLGQVLAYLT